MSKQALYSRISLSYNMPVGTERRCSAAAAGKGFSGAVNVIGLIVAILVIAAFIWLLVRPYKEATVLKTKVRV